MEVLLNVIKNIFCDDEFSLECNKCSLCHLIDISSLPSLKIIEPDGNFIKKDQIQELKYLFAKEATFTKENIYIIKNCEKMNKESANTMLKFLEEPRGNVIGFFITENLDNVMLTIQSRCQHLDVRFNNEDYENFNIDKAKFEEYQNILREYIYELEVNRKELVLANKKYLEDYEKSDIIILFKMLLNVYMKELKRKITNNEVDSGFEFLNKYSFDNLNKKVKLLMEILYKINYNVNLDLLLDRFILEMEVINNEVI